ncbi:MAG: CpaD family pilus assembly lipoprotein [Pseudomonadota bacterium]
MTPSATIFGNAVRLAAAVAAPLLLSGCLQGGQLHEPTHRLNPTQVAESVERMELYARPDGLVLSQRDEFAVTRFLQDYAAQGSGPIYINRPSAAAGSPGLVQTDALLGRLMGQAGLNPAAAQSGTYYTRPGDPAPVVLSYRTLRAVAQDCAHMGDLSVTHRNTVMPEFGCFASANLAAMITDPRQLIEPYATQTPNAQRRQVVYDRYIEGTGTASERPEGQQQSSQDAGG